MSKYQHRLERLEGATSPAVEPMHILHVIVDPDAPGDMAVSVIAVGDDRALTEFVREPGESKDSLCERARLAMGWEP